MTEDRKFAFQQMVGVWGYKVDFQNGHVSGGLVWEEGRVARRSVSERRMSFDVVGVAILRCEYTVLKSLNGHEVTKRAVERLDSI